MRNKRIPSKPTEVEAPKPSKAKKGKKKATKKKVVKEVKPEAEDEEGEKEPVKLPPSDQEISNI